MGNAASFPIDSGEGDGESSTPAQDGNSQNSQKLSNQPASAQQADRSADENAAPNRQTSTRATQPTTTTTTATRTQAPPPPLPPRPFKLSPELEAQRQALIQKTEEFIAAKDEVTRKFHAFDERVNRLQRVVAASGIQTVVAAAETRVGGS